MDIQIGSVVEVTVKDVREFGFIVELAPGVECLLHIAQISHDFVSLLFNSLSSPDPTSHDERVWSDFLVLHTIIA